MKMFVGLFCDKSYMLFLTGTEASRRMFEVNRLNSDYAKMVDVAMNMESIYHCMVNRENYRMLAHFHYNLDETPLRSARLSAAPPMTDVIIKKHININFEHLI